MHCCAKIFCVCSVHQHIVIWVDVAGPQRSFHFLLITQRKPMTSLARGAESGFLINQNDFFFHGVSQENYVVKSRWAHNRPQSKKFNKMSQEPPAKASPSLGSGVCLQRHHRAEIYNSGNAGGQQRVKETRKSWRFLVYSGAHCCRSHCRLEGAGQNENVFSGPKDA